MAQGEYFPVHAMVQISIWKYLPPSPLYFYKVSKNEKCDKNSEKFSKFTICSYIVLRRPSWACFFASSPHKCRLNPLKLCGLFATSDTSPSGHYNMLSGNSGIP